MDTASASGSLASSAFARTSASATALAPTLSPSASASASVPGLPRPPDTSNDTSHPKIPPKKSSFFQKLRRTYSLSPSFGRQISSSFQNLTSLSLPWQHPHPSTLSPFLPFLACLLLLLLNLALFPFSHFGHRPPSSGSGQNEDLSTPPDSPALLLHQSFPSLDCANFFHLPYTPAIRWPGMIQPHGVAGFVLVSAHRVSSSAFAVVGLTPPSSHAAWGSYQELCLWVSYSGPTTIQGHLGFHFLFGNSSTTMQYDLVVIHCQLDSATPNNGGALFVNIQELDEEMVYQEQPGKRRPYLDPPPTMPSTLTVCSTLLQPNLVSLSATGSVVEFLQYLRYLGATGFVVYDGGAVSARMAAAFVPFVVAGLLEIVDFKGLTRFQAPTDAVVGTDCALRSRFVSAWAVVLEPDEYPSFPEASGMLTALLQENAGRPWLSFGVYVWDVEMCTDIELDTLWFHEKMIWRKRHAVCLAPDDDPKLCIGDQGWRRVVFDPRVVGMMGQHAVAYPELPGIDLSVDSCRINKYLGILAPAALECEYPVAHDHVTEEWHWDDSMKHVVELARGSGELSSPPPLAQ